ENPLFDASAARLTVGRDGKVYLAVWGLTGSNYEGFVLRISREGKDKVGAKVLPAANATANKDGVMATASPGAGGHRVALYDRAFRGLGGVDDFDANSYSPTHVEAGAGGAFYGLDAHRRQVVGLSPAGKHLKPYRLPDGLPKAPHPRTYRDFR